jgi:hypothetical protein
MFQTAAALEVANTILFLAFGNLTFEFVSDFDIRISNFAKSLFYEHILWSSAKVETFDQDFCYGAVSRINR